MIDGRAICIERFEDETDASFSERSSFVLAFANDSARGQDAKIVGLYSVAKMFQGVTYNDSVEARILEFREMAKANIAASNAQTLI